MWTNEFVDSPGVYSRVSVARATTPDYLAAVEKGTLKALPYSLSIDRSLKLPLVVKSSFDGKSWTTSTWSGDWMDDSTTSVQAISKDIRSKISEYNKNRDNRVLKKLKGKSLPLVMAWREREETGKLLLSTANRIVDACKVIRSPKQFIRRLYRNNTRGKKLKVMERRAQKAYVQFLKYKKWPKSRKPRVGDLFLQYEFAWKPLIMDIQDSLDSTAETEKRLAGGHVRVGYNFEAQSTRLGGRDSGTELELTAKASVVGHQKVYWRVDNIALAAMSQIQSLPETLWDALPYSFVVDWFVNVGEYLELRNATLGIAFHDGYKSVMTEVRYTSEARPTFKLPGSRYISAQSNWPERYQFSFSRQILTSFPTPHLLTDFSMPSSLVHIGEGAALVQQALSRKL